MDRGSNPAKTILFFSSLDFSEISEGRRVKNFRKFPKGEGLNCLRKFTSQGTCSHIHSEVFLGNMRCFWDSVVAYHTVWYFRFLLEVCLFIFSINHKPLVEAFCRFSLLFRSFSSRTSLSLQGLWLTDQLFLEEFPGCWLPSWARRKIMHLLFLTRLLVHQRMNANGNSTK
jgi:hypothetical protein